jgi:hypothetical protein
MAREESGGEDSERGESEELLESGSRSKEEGLRKAGGEELRIRGDRGGVFEKGVEAERVVVCVSSKESEKDNKEVEDKEEFANSSR